MAHLPSTAIFTTVSIRKFVLNLGEMDLGSALLGCVTLRKPLAILSFDCLIFKTGLLESATARSCENPMKP